MSEPEEGTRRRAKVFWSGHSQAVRLPKSFRFDPETEEVVIRREGEKVILEPVTPSQWPEDFWEAFGDMPEGFERPAQVRQVREDVEL
ncbi:MAG: antitoxin [Thermoanaerobaculia bacterium]